MGGARVKRGAGSWALSLRCGGRVMDATRRRRTRTIARLHWYAWWRTIRFAHLGGRSSERIHVGTCGASYFISPASPFAASVSASLIPTELHPVQHFARFGDPFG